MKKSLKGRNSPRLELAVKIISKLKNRSRRYIEIVNLQNSEKENVEKGTESQRNGRNH